MSDKQNSGAKIKVIVTLVVIAVVLAVLWVIFPLLNIPLAFGRNTKCAYFDETHRYTVGEHFYFGRSKADENGGIDIIEWRVIRVERDRLILVSDRIIECKAFNSGKNEVTWETSSLRSWLNGEFYQNSFSDEEKSRILDVTVPNPDNEFFGTDGGSATVDKVYCLSIDEAEKYFSHKTTWKDGVTVYADLMANPNEYVRDKQQDSPFEKDWWWLRTPGQHYGTTAAYVDKNGFICDVGESTTHDGGGVRPVISIER